MMKIQLYLNQNQTIRWRDLTSLLSALFMANNCFAAAEQGLNNISIDNAIESCFKVSPIRVGISHNLLLLESETSSIKSIGECGCKSAMASYHAMYENAALLISHEAYGVFSSNVTGKHSFLLTQNYIPNQSISYTLSISCAQPY